MCTKNRPAQHSMQRPKHLGSKLLNAFLPKVEWCSIFLNDSSYICYIIRHCDKRIEKATFCGGLKIHFSEKKMASFRFTGYCSGDLRFILN